MFRSIFTEYEHGIWWVCRDLPKKFKSVFRGKKTHAASTGTIAAPNTHRSGRKKFSQWGIFSKIAGRIWKKCENAEKNTVEIEKSQFMTSTFKVDKKN